MKRQIKKLQVDKQTLATLNVRSLDNEQLGHVAGGSLQLPCTPPGKTHSCLWLCG